MALQARPPIQWLGATAIHSEDESLPTLVSSLVALCDIYPQLEMLINIFDAAAVNAHALVAGLSGNHSRIEGTWVPGMKTRFWKQVLTPARTRGLRAVWVFDCDIAVHPSVFPLGQVAGVLRGTRATVVQPSIRAQVHGTYHTWLRVRPTHPSCVATTAGWVEMQTPLFAGDAWARLHEGVFSLIPDEAMGDSDFGLDLIWCAFLRDAFPSRPSCLVVPAEAATHLNSHTIEKYMTVEIKNRERSCAATCRVLQANFRHYWKNNSHHTHECYGVATSRHQPASRSGGRYARDGRGVVHERRDEVHSDSGLRDSRNASARAGPLPHAAAAILGATHLSWRAREVGQLVASLSKLVGQVPSLRITVNFFDGPAEGGPAAGAARDAHVDLRIRTTWMPISRAVFWKRLLEPAAMLESVTHIWLFDASHAVHPAVNPLRQLLAVMDATNASVLLPPSPMHLNAALAPNHDGARGALRFMGRSRRGCTAATARVARFEPFALVTREAWGHFHSNGLARVDDAALAVAEPGLGLLLCGLAARGAPSRPACVESYGVAIYPSNPWRVRPAVPRPCPEPSCAAPLRRIFGDAFNASAHDDGRCWAIGAEARLPLYS